MATHVNVELPPRMVAAIEELAERLAIGKPEVLRRALALYMLAVKETSGPEAGQGGVGGKPRRQLAIEEDGRVKEIITL